MIGRGQRWLHRLWRQPHQCAAPRPSPRRCRRSCPRCRCPPSTAPSRCWSGWARSSTRTSGTARRCTTCPIGATSTRRRRHQVIELPDDYLADLAGVARSSTGSPSSPATSPCSAPAPRRRRSPSVRGPAGQVGCNPAGAAGEGRPRDRSRGAPGGGRPGAPRRPGGRGRRRRPRSGRRRSPGADSSSVYGRSCVITRVVSGRTAQHLGELATGHRVEVGGRLVEHQHVGAPWPARSPATATLSTLAEAQAARRPVGHVGHAHRGEGLIHPAARASPRRPRLAGPKATSRPTVGMNSWSSGSWNTMPTRRRTSRRRPSSPWYAADAHHIRAPAARIPFRRSATPPAAPPAQQRHPLTRVPRGGPPRTAPGAHRVGRRAAQAANLDGRDHATIHQATRLMAVARADAERPRPLGVTGPGGRRRRGSAPS